MALKFQQLEIAGNHFPKAYSFLLSHCHIAVNETF